MVWWGEGGGGSFLSGFSSAGMLPIAGENFVNDPKVLQFDSKGREGGRGFNSHGWMDGWIGWSIVVGGISKV